MTATYAAATPGLPFGQPTLTGGPAAAPPAEAFPGGAL